MLHAFTATLFLLLLAALAALIVAMLGAAGDGRLSAVERGMGSWEKGGGLGNP